MDSYPTAKFWQASKKFDTACEKYLAKFGADSLDRVVLVDPLNEGTTKEDEKAAIAAFLEGFEVLDRAIRENKPIEQIPEEMLAGMVF